jgi:hypothetical protein
MWEIQIISFIEVFLCITVLSSDYGPPCCRGSLLSFRKSLVLFIDPETRLNNADSYLYPNQRHREIALFFSVANYEHCITNDGVMGDLGNETF